MSILYNFAQSQEDECTEAAALRLADSDRVLSIASAGDMPLSLAALGARQVTAIDIDPAQLALTGLKLASVLTLSRGDAIGFLGYMPMGPDQRRALYDKVRPALTPEQQQFWDLGMSGLKSGAIWAGRFERYLRWLRLLIVPLLGRSQIQRLCECTSQQEQEHLFNTSINKPYLRSIFRFAFNPRVYSGRGVDARSLAHRTSEIPLGDQYFGWFRSFCTVSPGRDDHFLQLTLLGRCLHADAVPAYLSETGYQRLRENPGRVVLHLGDIIQFLKDMPAASLDKAHLSNICDWLDQPSFEEVMRLLSVKCASARRIVWRFMHADRALPPDLKEHVVEERDLGLELRRRDRYPFYTIVPAHVIA